MQFGIWDTLFNIILFLFWFAAWSSMDRNTVFNPYLAQISRISDALINFLRPVFFKTPSRIIALSALLFIILFRGIMFHGIAATRETSWSLIMGAPFKLSGQADILTSLAFSLASFLIFIFNIWGIGLLYFMTTRKTPSSRSKGLLYYLNRPCIDAPPMARPFILIALGSLIIFLIHSAQAHAMPLWQLSHGKNNPFYFIIQSLIGWTNVLPIIQQIMLILIIGSWISTFTGSGGLAIICSEWIDFLLGPMRRRRLIIGMFDITPIIFIFAVLFIHGILLSILNAFLRLFS